MARFIEYQTGDRVHGYYPKEYTNLYIEGTVLGHIFFGGTTTHYYVLWDGEDEPSEEGLGKGWRV